MLTHLGTVLLGAGVSFAVRRDEDKAMILRALGAAIGQDPMAFARRHQRYRRSQHAAILRQGQQHVAGLRAGKACYLFLMRVPDSGAGVCVLVDHRTSQGFFYPRMSLVHVAFHESELFEGTVIDAELVSTSSSSTQATLVAGDLLALAGRSTASMALARRVDTLRRVVEARPTTAVGDEPFAIVMKHYFRPRDLHSIVSRLSELDYRVHGVVFKHLSNMSYEPPIVFALPSHAGPRPVVAAESGPEDVKDSASVDSESDNPTSVESESELTPKPEAPTSMFHVRRTGMPDVYELFATRDDMDRVPVGAGKLLAGVPTLAASRSLESAMAACGGDAHLRFTYSQRFGRWVPAQQ